MLRSFAHPVTCCCAKFGTSQTFEPTNSQHFFCSVVAEAKRSHVGSVYTALPTLLGPRTCILHVVSFETATQPCWIRLHCSSNIIRAAHVHLTRGLLRESNATMLDPFTLLFQHCWGRSRASYTWSPWKQQRNNFAWWANIVGSSCIRLHSRLHVA